MMTHLLLNNLLITIIFVHVQSKDVLKKLTREDVDSIHYCYKNVLFEKNQITKLLHGPCCLEFYKNECLRIRLNQNFNIWSIFLEVKGAKNITANRVDIFIETGKRKIMKYNKKNTYRKVNALVLKIIENITVANLEAYVTSRSLSHAIKQNGSQTNQSVASSLTREYFDNISTPSGEFNHTTLTRANQKTVNQGLQQNSWILGWNNLTWILVVMIAFGIVLVLFLMLDTTRRWVSPRLRSSHEAVMDFVKKLEFQLDLLRKSEDGAETRNKRAQ